jgi:hypothetical protein
MCLQRRAADPLDERELQVRLLELEYRDCLSRREVMHYAQWGAPLGWLTATIAAGWIRDFGSILIIGIIAWMLSSLIGDERTKYDLNLEAILFVISDLRTPSSASETTVLTKTKTRAKQKHR